MTKVIDTVTDYEAKALELLTKIQEQVLDYLKQGVTFVDERISDVDIPFELPEIEALDELIDEVPTLKEIVDTQFAFSKKLLANQEKFAKNVVKAVKPITRQPATTKTSTSKSTTTKSAA